MEQAKSNLRSSSSISPGTNYYGNKITILLILLVFPQWILIAHLITREGNLIPHLQQQQQQELEQNQQPQEFLMKESYVLQNVIKYEGVAVTFFLNSPRWYQRRYSDMISNVLVNIPSNWCIQIFYAGEQSKIAFEINPGISNLIQSFPNRIILTQIDDPLVKEFGLRRKLNYLTSPWIWETMVADRVLLFSGNGAFCSNSKTSFQTLLPLFNQVDYVGTPWNTFHGRGGAGDVSYRNRTIMLEALQYQSNTKGLPGDQYIITTLDQMNRKESSSSSTKEKYRIATREQTFQFGGDWEMLNNASSVDILEKEYGVPFIVAGTIPKMDHDKRHRLLEICPELKMIFPALHNPSCFGAKPDGKECAEHICALRDASERPQGC